jgi:hypothetical protein
MPLRMSSEIKMMFITWVMRIQAGKSSSGTSVPPHGLLMITT